MHKSQMYRILIIKYKTSVLMPAFFMDLGTSLILKILQLLNEIHRRLLIVK